MVAGETVNAAVGAMTVPPTVTAFDRGARLARRVRDRQADREGTGARVAVRLGDAAAEPAVAEVPVVAGDRAARSGLRRVGVEEHLLVDTRRIRRQREDRRRIGDARRPSTACVTVLLRPRSFVTTRRTLNVPRVGKRVVTRAPLPVWPLPKSHWIGRDRRPTWGCTSSRRSDSPDPARTTAIDALPSKITSCSSPGLVGDIVNRATGENGCGSRMPCGTSRIWTWRTTALR